MEDNANAKDESQPIYEALQEVDEEDCNAISETMETEENYNMFVEGQKEDGQYDSDHDTEAGGISQTLNHSNESNDQQEDEEDISLEYEEEEELCEDYGLEGSESYADAITSDKTNDPLIVHDDDGMIKKIKICNATKDVTDKNESKTKKISNSAHGDGNNSKFLTRSSTPMSREYLALQRSVNESKILTEFVTHAANEKPRKLRTKDSANSHISSAADHSYSSLKKSNQLSPGKGNSDDINTSVAASYGKRQYSKRYIPLKDSDSDMDSSSNLRPRSRSKSVHNREHYLTSSSHKKLKKWPSEERLHKRSNMRSENSEFAQKQMEFLQRVIHACENPRSRSRSGSCGRSPTSFNELSTGGGGGSVNSSQQQKTHKSCSKERNSKRTKYEMSSENDEQILGENNSEQPDDEYVMESQSSLMGLNSTGDNILGDNNEVETHLKSVWQPSPKAGYDSFCWKCHENKVNLCCCKCIRSFHAACIKINKFDNIWLCPDCTAVENLLNNPKRSRRNELSIDLLSQLLSFALKRMRYTKGLYSFVMPYEESTIYKKYIVNPVSLGSLQKKIEAKEFRCSEEFVNETKWILHNAYILSSRNNTKIVLAAKSIFKICRQEVNEIETCAECYLNANTRTDWFVDVCSQPHLLLWAKLKGFPYWPAKAMGLGPNSLINVRFFGEHDRAFVPLKDCFLYSEQDPNTATGKRAARELADCIKEVEEHIEKIKCKVGGFKCAPFKTPYEPAEEMKQLSEMMPGVADFMKKQQGIVMKPSLQFKIYKTADNNLSIVQKASKTPELTDIEEKEKKKKLSIELNDCKKLEESPITAAKYEVVSKVGSDESNSSKLSTVILKRKSVNGDSKKINDDESVELPLPKMTKIEEWASAEDDKNNLGGKRKLENQSAEKPKAKTAKLEPKIPIMTIKTSMPKTSPETHGNETTAKKLNASSITTNNHNDTTKPISGTQEIEGNEKSTETQKVMENLVKHKQGVTIKKIPSPNLTEQSSLDTFKESRLENSKTKKVSKLISDDEKARENQKVNNILKGLVPFVEVKKEVLTDNEDEIEKPQESEKTEKNTPADISTNKEIPPTAPEITEDNTQADNDNNDKDKNKTDVDTTEKRAEREDVTEPIAEVKQEILSDEDEINASVALKRSPNKPATPDPLQISTTSSNSSAEKQTAATSSNGVVVVGDTTIQKLPNKANQVQYYAYSSNPATNNVLTDNSTGTSTSTSNNNNNNHSTKRFSLKGVPYGPLPASAVPKGLKSKSFHQSDINCQPRAKKSFPQHSPPMEKPKLHNSQNSLTQTSATISNQHLDQKRMMAKNTMVTIPVDVAINRASTSAGTIIIGSIPVPPLTAVSKTVPSLSAHSSTPRNSSANIIVSGTPASLTTASVMMQTKPSTSTLSTTTCTVRNSPITVTSSSSLLAPLITSSTSLASAPVSTALLKPLTMTTPPPLAGLSSNSLISTSQTNDTNSSTIITASTTTQQSSAETHILGGLVTPTLASAITDIICKGPPKLAARPTAPLQSEGYPMFPSQAGPVCKRLVENVHKLTDFFISVVEDTMGEMAQGDEASLQAKNTLLTMELERNKQAYDQEIAELKRTSDLMLCEMRKSMENEKTRLVVEIRKQCEMERLRSVEETKRKQWCANCFREANFYCCWNTSYCDYPCQQLHWSRHSQTCAQTRPMGNETGNTSTTATQSERYHPGKSNSTITLSSTANFSKSSTLSQKKEKGAAAKNTGNHMISSITAATPTAASRTNTEVLKLPSNTYLRPVTSNLNNQTLRCNTTYSLPIQRFNAPMPITTPANSSTPQTYTIVQQGNSWVMSSTANNSSTNNSNNSTNPSSIAAASNASVSQVTAQLRTGGTGLGTTISNKTSKTQIRYH